MYKEYKVTVTAHARTYNVIETDPDKAIIKARNLCLRDRMIPDQSSVVELGRMETITLPLCTSF